MERLADELDNQEMHLRRLARRIDALQPDPGDVELRVSRLFHSKLEEVHSFWPDDGPPGWPDPTTKVLGRVGPLRKALELVAEAVDRVAGTALKEAVERDLDRGRDRMPFRLEGKLHGTPMVVSPENLERDSYEFVFNPQQEALLRVDSAIDDLEGGGRSSQ